MKATEQINILKSAGYFKSGEDAYSLISHINSMAEDIKRLCDERDEARRNVCFIEAANLSFGPNGIPYHQSVAHKIAKDYGWDCFKEIK